MHRIGRTARAGQHGVSITLCNEEERKDLKKLSRKLCQNVNTFTIQNKLVEPLYANIHQNLDRLLKQIQADLQQEREMKEAIREIQRSENLIKYKKDIESRPKKEWFMGRGKRENIAKESKDDLQNIKKKFEHYNTGLQQNRDHQKKKRDRKRESKREEASKKRSASTSSAGKDAGKKGKHDKGGAKAGEEPKKFFKKKKQLFKKR